MVLVLCKQAKCRMKVASQAWRGGPICQRPFIKYGGRHWQMWWLHFFFPESKKGYKRCYRVNIIFRWSLESQLIYILLLILFSFTILHFFSLNFITFAICILFPPHLQSAKKLKEKKTQQQMCFFPVMQNVKFNFQCFQWYELLVFWWTLFFFHLKMDASTQGYGKWAFVTSQRAAMPLPGTILKSSSLYNF